MFNQLRLICYELLVSNGNTFHKLCGNHLVHSVSAPAL